MGNQERRKGFNTTQHRRKSAQKSKNTHSFFCLKKITKKRKFTSQFFEKKFHPKFFLSFFTIFYNLLASLGIANFKLDCDSYLFLFSLSLTLLSLLEATTFISQFMMNEHFAKLLSNQ